MKKEITKEEFKNAVLQSPHLILVKFKTEWSGACQILVPMFNELSEYYKGLVNFFLVDTDKEPYLHDEYGIVELPTILFFKNGQLVDHAIGLIPKDFLITKIENALTLN